MLFFFVKEFFKVFLRFSKVFLEFSVYFWSKSFNILNMHPCFGLFLVGPRAVSWSSIPKELSSCCFIGAFDVGHPLQIPFHRQFSLAKKTYCLPSAFFFKVGKATGNKKT